MQSGDIIGNYRIVRLLGTGGMGAVYEAVHTAIDRRVALKVIHEHLAHKTDTIARFFNEARATNHIEHPSIIQVSDFGHAPSGAPYLVMEFLNGVSLDKRLEQLAARNERLDVATALQIAWQVADALTIAHANGIVHRDLEPENLMLIEDPVAPSGERVKILDFGIAKLTGSNAPSTAQTAANAVLGSPRYMSPEQCAGAGGVDDKSDVYALGVILYEMLARRRPFDSTGVGELFLFHMTKEPDPLSVIAPTVPADVARLVHKMLAKSKAARPVMKQVQSELSNLLLSLSVSNFTTRRRASGAMAMADMLPSGRSTAGSSGGGGVHTTLGESLGQTLQAVSRSRPKQLVVAVGTLLLCVSMLMLFLRSVPRKDSPLPAIVQTTAAPLQSPSQSPSQTPSQSPSQSPSAGSTASSPQPPGQDVATEKIQWKIESAPSGAAVLDSKGTTLGQTPWTSHRQYGQGVSQVFLRKRGYAAASLSLPHDRDVSQTVRLSAQVRTLSSKKQPKKQGKGLEIED